MSASNQQTLIDSGANDRPPMLKKWNYIPWESRFRRFLDNKLKDEERMWRSIQKGPYERPMIPDPDDTQVHILEPLSKMTESNKKQYIADVKVMNYLLQAIPNDIYNSMDACKNAKEVVDYEEDYQGELQGDSQEDKLTTAVMLLVQAITQKFSTPTNNRYGGNGNKNAGRKNMNQAFNACNGNDESNQIIQGVS
ncbi:hypothetical protein Tco_1060449 [Tanacetum coccineum]